VIRGLAALLALLMCSHPFNQPAYCWPWCFRRPFKVHNVDEALNALRALVQEAKQQGTHAS
jgi:hypothetical protein